MWWRDLANRYAHGQLMPWHVSIVWRCERCGGSVFRVLSWDKWDEGFGIARRILLECPACGCEEITTAVTLSMR